MFTTIICKCDATIITYVLVVVTRALRHIGCNSSKRQIYAKLFLPKTKRQPPYVKRTMWSEGFPGFEQVSTDGSSLGNGKKKAAAGVGVYFGPNDPRCESISTSQHAMRTASCLTTD